MKKLLRQLGLLGGGGDADTFEEACARAAADGKPVLVDLYVPM